MTTTITRNAFGEMTQATQSGGGVSATRTYRYDSQHRLCRQIDPETGSTVYSYNNADRLAWYALAASGGTGACNLGSVPTGERIVHTYNNVGQLTLLNYPDSTPDLTYNYDDNGNLDTLTSSSASWDYDYNAVNALREEKLITSGQTFVLTYGFDTMGRLISVTYPSSQVVSITPNAYGEPEVVGGYAAGFNYHPNGSIASLTYGNGRVYSTTQNDRQLPWELKVMNGGSTVAKYTHTYDANANILAIDDGVNATSYDRTMTYDDLDRLKTASGFWGSGSYSYDALGNILNKTEGGQAMTYGYHAPSNRLTAITGANARSFSYDAYGNVVNNGVHSFTYNLAGNLTRTSDLDIDYRYDGHKRRVQEIDNNAPQTTYSMYSQSGQLMHKRKGGVSTDYIYAGSLLVAEKTGSTVDYMYTDLLGSPIAGNNGSAYKEHYRPWGDKKDHPIQLADDVGYTGHQSDIETGLAYMQARYYDPVVGRFMAVDPVEFGGSNPGQFGRYTYAQNNPYKYIDPDGRNIVLAAFSRKLAERMIVPLINATLVTVSGGLVLSLGDGVYQLLNEEIDPTLPVHQNESNDESDNGSGSGWVYDPESDSMVPPDELSGAGGAGKNDDNENDNKRKSKKGGKSETERASHTKGTRKSTREKHERGDARRDRDAGNEKGDRRRRY